MSWSSASLVLLSLHLLSSEQDFKEDINVRLLKASVESFFQPVASIRRMPVPTSRRLSPAFYASVTSITSASEALQMRRKVTLSSLCECSVLNLRRSLFFRVKVPYIALWPSLVLYGWASNCQGSRADWHTQPMIPYLSTAPGERDMS